MPFVPANSTAQVSLRYTVGDQRVENTLYIASEFGGTPPLGTVAALAEGLWDDYRLILGTFVTLREIYVTDLENATAPVLSVPLTPPENGANVAAGAALPNNVTLAISFRTLGRGRSARGRNFVPALGEDQVVGNNVLPATVDAIVAAYNAFNVAVSAAGFQWSIVSRYQGGVPRAAALVQPVVSVLAVDTGVDSMRRRLPGRGI